jgi:hypothetical protein
MEWNPTWENPLTSYVKHFDGLIGDRGTHETFGEIVNVIIGAGSLICHERSSGFLQTNVPGERTHFTFRDTGALQEHSHHRGLQNTPTRGDG